MAQQTAAWATGRKVAKWRENPERLAWIVILSSFLIFLLLAISIPLTINYVVRYATVSQEGRLEPTLGTLLLYPTRNTEPIAITTNSRSDVKEGARIVAGDDATQGTLGLIQVEGSDITLGSVQIFAGTVIDVQRIRQPFFRSSPEPYQVKLYLQKGQARIFTNSGDEHALHVELETPHGNIALAAGSYQVSVEAEQTDVNVNSGHADVVHATGAHIAVDTGMRITLAKDGLVQPATGEQNLIRNGDFSEPMLDMWQSEVKAENVIPGSVRVIEREGRRVAHFIRQGEENVNTEVSITQHIGKDVNVYDSLVLQLDVKLLHQSLSGAGYLSSEFPLRVELIYVDIYGKTLSWGHGFYYRDPEQENWRIMGGVKIPPYIWYTYRSPNLIEALDQEGTRPARIESVRIYASGWNYQSMVSEVYLNAE
jgi:hypothetical protein